MPLIEVDSMSMATGGGKEDDLYAERDRLVKSIQGYEESLKTQKRLPYREDARYKQLKDKRKVVDEKIYRLEHGVPTGPVDPRSPARKAQDIKDQQIAVEKTRVGSLPFTMAHVDERFNLSPKNRETVKTYANYVSKERGFIPRGKRKEILDLLETPGGVGILRDRNFEFQSKDPARDAGLPLIRRQKWVRPGEYVSPKAIRFQEKKFNFDPFAGLKFSQESFEEAIRTETSSVLNRDGTETSIDRAMQAVQNRTGLSSIQQVGRTKLSEEQKLQRTYTANGTQGPGKGFGFNDGQTNDQVARGLDQWRIYEQTYFPNGVPRTDSSHHREFANNTKRDLKAFLTRNYFPGFAADMVAETLLLPLEIGAEAHTFSDPNESVEVRAGAATNAIIGLLSTARGGKLVSAALRPVSALLAKAAAPLLKNGAQEALKRFSYALHSKKDEAIRILHEELKVPFEEAKRTVLGYRKRLDDLWKQVGPKAKRDVKGSPRPTGPAGVKYSSKATNGRSGFEPNLDEVEESLPGKEGFRAEMKRESERGSDNAFFYKNKETIFKVADDFVSNVPKEFLADVRLTFKNEIKTLGEYKHGQYGAMKRLNEETGKLESAGFIISLSRKLRADPDKGEIIRTLIHEIVHAFEEKLPEHEREILKAQFLKERKLDAADWNEEMAEDCSEWFSDKMERLYDRTFIPQKLLEHAKTPYDKILARNAIAFRKFETRVSSLIFRKSQDANLERLARKLQGAKE